jgi:hypothetical protein
MEQRSHDGVCSDEAVFVFGNKQCLLQELQNLSTVQEGLNLVQCPRF